MTSEAGVIRLPGAGVEATATCALTLVRSEPDQLHLGLLRQDVGLERVLHLQWHRVSRGDRVHRVADVAAAREGEEEEGGRREPSKSEEGGSATTARVVHARTVARVPRGALVTHPAGVGLPAR